MKKLLLCSVALAAALGTTAEAAVVVHTTNFISAPTNFNGFEKIASDPGFSAPIFYSGTSTYTEDGISVNYVNGTSPQEMWLTYLREGNFGWYNDGGGFGYTRIRMANGSDFGAIQFLAGSGFGTDSPMQYMLVNDGQAVASGVAGPVGASLRFYGFSGVAFDEVWLQNTFRGTDFDGNSPLEALAIDSISVGSAGGVPEPAAWAMMLAGFGLVGSAMRRREKVAVTFA